MHGYIFIVKLVGRTTTFLAMYDMMKNPQVPLKDILYRQLLLGGNYVAYTDISASSNWKAPYYNQKSKNDRSFLSICRKIIRIISKFYGQIGLKIIVYKQANI